MVKVVTYNVLSTNLASPDYFTGCKSAYLNPIYRLSLLREKLEKEIDDGAIICLQEISQTCVNLLHPFFSTRGYYFVTASYGNKFDGYMGVGIAVSLDLYLIQKVDIVTLGNTLKIPNKVPLGKWQQWIQKWIYSPWFALLTQLGLYHSPPENPFILASQRQNQMITLELSPLEDIDKKQILFPSFFVGTYHMPCQFLNPKLMTIHSVLAAKRIQMLAKGTFNQSKPYVLVGDFNIKPTDAMYTLLTQGSISPDDSAFPCDILSKKSPSEIQITHFGNMACMDSSSPNTSWFDCSVEPMRSAYASHCGKEPDFTNWAKVRDSPPFINVLDYIFLSPHWNIRNIQELPSRTSIQGPLPTKEEPSDHLLLSAEIDILPSSFVHNIFACSEFIP